VGTIVGILAGSSLALSLFSCENNDISVPAGTFPETGGIDQPLGMLRSNNHVRENPLIDMDHRDMADRLHVSLTQPAEANSTYTIRVDEAAVAVFNAAKGTKYELFPPGQVVLSDDSRLTVERGKLQSADLTVTFRYDTSLASAVYLLPLTVDTEGASTAVAGKRQTLYYRISVWGEVPPEYDATPKNYIQIGGVDPEFVNPLIMSKLYIENDEPLLYFNPFDIVNLLSATVRKDADGLPELYLKDDLAYVLQKREKYIVPLQKLNHQTCLTIKGGKEGVGFSYLDGPAMSIFIQRIKDVIDYYQLDGVNLYDIDFNYAASAVDDGEAARTLCRFVAKLKEALGHKIITYTQSAESPQSISEEQDGIGLGALVDYAWTDRVNKIINPWDTPEGWWTKPIAGLEKERWGALNSDIHLSYEEQEAINAYIFDEPRMIEEGINHVFVVDKVEQVKADGTDGTYAVYITWGSECNIYEIYGGVTQIGPVGNNDNFGYGSPHWEFVPKDY
jgi:hypothetical protein